MHKARHLNENGAPTKAELRKSIHSNSEALTTKKSKSIESCVFHSHIAYVFNHINIYFSTTTGHSEEKSK